MSKQGFLFSGRVIAWFSCGAASAVAALKAIERHGEKVIVAYCDTSAEEHPDNERFLKECETKLFKREILRLKNPDFPSGKPTDVFEKTQYMSGSSGARCTTELKKMPRHAFAWANDVHVFGFTADEGKRIAEFEQNNPELFLDWVLKKEGITKQNCYRIVSEFGIELPALYRMGYPHNNCLGCVKAASPGYWNKIRKDFPEVFKSRAEQSRRLGVKLAKVAGERVFLDELDPTLTGNWKDEVISCGPDCKPTE